jgi:hypothetical protein
MEPVAGEKLGNAGKGAEMASQLRLKGDSSDGYGLTSLEGRVAAPGGLIAM